MKKKDLLEFIDRVEAKAIKSVEERFGKLIATEKFNTLDSKGYVERINKIQKKVNDLFLEAQNLVLDLKEDVAGFPLISEIFAIKFIVPFTLPLSISVIAVLFIFSKSANCCCVKLLSILNALILSFNKIFNPFDIYINSFMP